MHKDVKLKKSVLNGLVILSVLLLLPNFSFALFGGKVESFSADFVAIDKNGKVVSTTKIYVTPDASRMDGMPGQMPNQGAGKKQPDITSITLHKEQMGYLYNHDDKLVFETTEEDSKEMIGIMKGMNDVSSEKVLGKEKVSGYKCVKKEVVSTFKFMGMTQKHKSIVWQSDRFEMPLRTQDEEGEITELRNIKTGKQSKKLFKPLKGYKKVNNIMAVMGMDFSSMMREDDEPQSQPDSESTAGSGNGGNEQPEQGEDVQKAIEETLQGLGDKLKNFKFGD